MAGNGSPTDDLTSKQAAFLAALLTEPCIAEAAKVAGVGERTAYRYLDEAPFKEAYRKARRETVSHAIVRVQQATTEAVETLREVMGDKMTPAPSRVSAARAILDTALRSVELEDMEERISRLEESAELLQVKDRR